MTPNLRYLLACRNKNFFLKTTLKRKSQRGSTIVHFW